MDHVTPPSNIFQQPDGFYYRRDGETTARVCEDCWKPIPKYIDFPQGLTSPESDGDSNGNFAKRQRTSIAVEAGYREVWEPLRKCVCLPCYNAAFQRVYPGARLPDLSGRVVENA
jgi:hypothetical protein